MNSVTRKLVGFEMQGKRIARHGNQVFIKGSKVGFVTSGGFSPTLKKSIGFCFVPLEMPFHQLVDISIARGSGGREEGAGAGREGQGGREEGEGERERETGAAETETIQTADDERLYSAKIRSTRFYKRNKDL
jgi:Glycine cleavage T-protein C-terminal barrel domain